MSLFERLEARDGVDASTLATVSSSVKRSPSIQSENPAKRSKIRKSQGMRAATVKEFNKRLASPAVRGQKHNHEDDPHIFSATSSATARAGGSMGLAGRADLCRLCGYGSEIAECGRDWTISAVRGKASAR